MAIGRPRKWLGDVTTVTTLRLPTELAAPFRESVPADQNLSSYVSDLAIRALGKDPLDYREPYLTEAPSESTLARRAAKEELEKKARQKLLIDQADQMLLSLYRNLWRRGASNVEFITIGLEPPSYPGWAADQPILLAYRNSDVRVKHGLPALEGLPERPTHPGTPTPQLRPAPEKLVSVTTPSSAIQTKESV